MEDAANLANMFAQLVKNKRATLGLSVASFASEAGVSPTSVMRAEKGKWLKDFVETKGTMRSRQFKGVSRTVQRLLRFVGEDAEIWCKKLGLHYRPDWRARYENLGAQILEAIQKLRLEAIIPDASRILEKPLSLEQAENLLSIVRVTATKSIPLRLVLELVGFFEEKPESGPPT